MNEFVTCTLLVAVCFALQPFTLRYATEGGLYPTILFIILLYISLVAWAAGPALGVSHIFAIGVPVVAAASSSLVRGIPAHFNRQNGPSTG